MQSSVISTPLMNSKFLSLFIIFSINKKINRFYLIIFITSESLKYFHYCCKAIAPRIINTLIKVLMDFSSQKHHVLSKTND